MGTDDVLILRALDLKKSDIILGPKELYTPK